MPAWAALLRGINIGGAHRVPMKELRALAEGLGWRNVQTYIASGNLVFDAEGTPPALAAGLEAAIAESFGFAVPVCLLRGGDLRAMLAACPFEPDDPRLVHLYFLMGTPAPDTALIATLKAPGEALELGPGVAYFHTPGGFGGSKLAEKMPRALNCAFTARNLRTARALAAMLD